MRTLEPNPRKVEKLFKDWTHRDYDTVKDVGGHFPNVDLPTVLYPRGGLVRIWYTSDKFMPESRHERENANYVHCNLVDASGKGKACVCGHIEHDELPSTFATIYDAEGADPNESAWPVQDPIKVVWPRLGAFCGYVSDWDEDRGNGEVYEVRARKPGWLVALDEETIAIFRFDGKVYLAHGADMRVTPRGLDG